MNAPARPRSGIRNLFLFILLIICSGCTNTGLFLANSIARRANFAVIENVDYGDLAEQRLDIYTPDPGSDEQQQGNPVVVFFYGGCWGACNTYQKEKYAFAAEALTTNGFIVVLPDYRLYPDVLFPEIIQDAAQAVEWVRDNIREYGGDADTIFLMGHSAGAHLAAMLTLNEQYLREDTHRHIRGLIGLAGPYDFMPFDQAYQRILFGPPEIHSQSQPINFVDGSEPPFLLLYGDEDKVVKPRNIDNLTTRARALGIDVTSIHYAGINHAGLVAALSRALRNHKPIANDVLTFLMDHTESRSSSDPERLQRSD